VPRIGDGFGPPEFVTRPRGQVIGGVMEVSAIAKRFRNSQDDGLGSKHGRRVGQAAGETLSLTRSSNSATHRTERYCPDGDPDRSDLHAFLASFDSNLGPVAIEPDARRRWHRIDSIGRTRTLFKRGLEKIVERSRNEIAC